MNRREFLAAPLALAACADVSSRTPAVIRDPATLDGWAAEHPADIHAALSSGVRLDVASRADLDAALRLGDKPKLLRVHGVIDLSEGCGAAQFADPAFDFDAYCRARPLAMWISAALNLTSGSFGALSRAAFKYERAVLRSSIIAL